MIDPEFLEILCCPETHAPLREASEEEVRTLNARIAGGTVANRSGETVSEPVDGGLIREGDDFLYPVRDGIPVLLIDEGIPLGAGGECPG